MICLLLLIPASEKGTWENFVSTVPPLGHRVAGYRSGQVIAGVSPAPSHDRDRDRPNHDHGASDVHVRPTTDGVRTSTARAAHAVPAVHDLPAGCAVHDAQWPDEDRVPRARCAAGTCHDRLREDAVQRPKQKQLPKQELAGTTCRF